jgi:uncharacterized protein YjbI with pentapeptide repeats
MDLSRDELSGLSWTGVRFDWLASSYMLKVDLRGANLTDSRWGPSSYLVGAFLQCADLREANLSGANLKYADLRGANVKGANFENANLHGAKLAGVFGTAKGLKPGLPADSWNPNPQSCLSNKQYWDKPPTP